jgi:hypothetical protein
MKTAGVQYSEAFAGSGEYAAVMLVRSVTRARPKSLILLDEPEVSLHPAAQRGVVAFLSDAARRWHHQVVFATHAPEMVRGLPVNAIKVLTVRADDGRVDIPTQDVAAYAAFDAVGASYDRPTVVVEDRLAEVLVKRAIQNLPIAGSVDVRFVPGGAETLWAHYMPMWAHDDRTSLLLLLDGDQRAEAPPPSANVGPNDLEVVLVESMKGIEPKLPYGASEANSQENREKSLRKVLDWRRLFVDFLSVRTPEEFLLRNFAARENYELPDGEKLDSKVEWHKIAASELDRDASGDEIFVFQQAELSKVSLEDESMTAIAMSVQNFVEGLVP